MTHQHTPSTRHIYSILCVEAMQAETRIEKLWSAALKKTNYKHTPATDALWMAFYCIKQRVNENLKKATEHGQLLMCWAGSKVTGLSKQEQVAA